MSKFKMKLKLQGFELEIEGTREDMPSISQNVGRQLAGLLQPAGAIIEGNTVEDERPIQPATILVAPSGKKRAKRKMTAAVSEVAAAATALVWKHDAAKYGMPKQDWTTANKSLWILYVIQEEGLATELTATDIGDTFNKHFRQAGSIRATNVSRDLGKAKLKAPSLVGEDTSRTPSAWYLTDEGRKVAQSLIAECKG